MLNRPSKFDLHNDIMSNFVSLTSYFLIRTLQDDLRAVQIELKGFESCLNVSVIECGHSLLPWTCTLDFYPNLAFFFFKWAFSYLDLMAAPAPTVTDLLLCAIYEGQLLVCPHWQCELAKKVGCQGQQSVRWSVVPVTGMERKPSDVTLN